MNDDETLAKAWLDAIVEDRQPAANTMAAYGADLQKYLNWLNKNGLTLRDVQRDGVDRFLQAFKEAGYAEKSYRRMRTTVKQVHTFLSATGWRETNPTIWFERLPDIKAEPYIMDIADVDRLLEVAYQLAADQRFDFRRRAGYARRVALLETLYATGMKVSEAITLSSDAIAPNAKALLVGASGKQRMVPINSKALDAIANWRALADELCLPHSKWVFHSLNDSETHLSRQAAFNEIKELAAAARIPNAEILSPSSLRHAFAAHLLKVGADPQLVQLMLGNADLKSMDSYTDSNEANILAEISKHPLQRDNSGREST